MDNTDPFNDYLDGNEAGDPFLDGIVRLEQIETRIPNNAKLIAQYYQALIDAGLPGQIVFVLVRDYATALTFNGY